MIPFYIKSGAYSIFDCACALHWYCSNYHSGQSSDLYRIMCKLNYTPGIMEHFPTGPALTIYNELVTEVLNPIELYDFINEHMK